MNAHIDGLAAPKNGQDYEAAMEKLEKLIYVTPDGRLGLEANYRELDIPAIVYSDLMRSLEETNKRIGRGEIDLAHIVGDLKRSR